MSEIGGGVFEFGPIRIIRGEAKYTEQVLTTLEDGSEIRKKIPEDKKRDIHYSLIKDEKEIGFISGRRTGRSIFHISRIENVTKDHASGYKLMQIFPILESDLRDSDITYLTTTALANIAPILIKRYGFREQSGLRYEEVRDSFARKIPKLGFGLIKRLPPPAVKR